MEHTWSPFFCQKAIEEAMLATPGHEKAEILQDTRSCIVLRSNDEGHDAEPSHHASKRFFFAYVDNLCVLGTSRVNVDKDLMMAVQTLKIGVWIHMRRSFTRTRPPPLGFTLICVTCW